MAQEHLDRCGACGEVAVPRALLLWGTCRACGTSVEYARAMRESRRRGPRRQIQPKPIRSDQEPAF